MNVLVVVEDRVLAGVLREALMKDRHVASFAHNIADGVELATSYNFDAMIVDFALAGANGVEVARRLKRARNSVPILMLTPRDMARDVVAGLDAIDDFVTKPFSPVEFVARLRAISRRANSSLLPIRSYKAGQITLDDVAHRVHRGNEEISLTVTEYRLLEFLMRRCGVAVSRRSIIEAVWGIEGDVEGNTLDAFIRLLRRKLEAGGQPRLIETVRGFGYRIVSDAES